MKINKVEIIPLDIPYQLPFRVSLHSDNLDDMVPFMVVSYNGEKEMFCIDIDISERKMADSELKKYREHLENIVKERTAELEEKNAELERFNKLFIDREFRIKELRDKVKKLEGGNSYQLTVNS